MWVIGIVGGIASGKSTVADHFRRCGAEVIDADLVGHEVLRDKEVQQALRRRWGDAVFDAQGDVDRSAVARRVFAAPPEGPEDLAFLEQVTHPHIAQRLQARLHELQNRRPAVPAVVLDAPVLLEAGLDAVCDKIVFVRAPRELRLERTRRRGWSPQDFAAREAAQESLNEKLRRADSVIDNSGCLENSLQQVQDFWRSLSSHALPRNP